MNPNQRSAVVSTAPWNIVLAGPGAGKTRVQTERARELITRGLTPQDFAFVTFTSNGAGVLRRRLDAMFPGQSVGFVGTLHSMMLGFLRRDNPLWTMVGEEDAAEFIQRQAKLLGFKGTADDLKDARSGRSNDSAALRVVRAYHQFMRGENLLDYDMVLTEGHKLLAARPGLNVWKCWFVDEFQDSAAVDMKIYLAVAPQELFVTADPDQSIFRFRGARPENVNDFWNDKRFAQHILSLNYRCAGSICDVANKVIELNPNRVPKKTVSAGPDAGTVHAFTARNERTERDAIVSFARAWISAGADPREIAVLCRTNKLMNELRDTLRSEGLPIADIEIEKKPRDWRLLTLIVSMIAAPESWALCRILVREQAKIMKGDPDVYERGMENWRREMPHKDPIAQWSFPSLKVILSLNADFSRYGVSPASHRLLTARIRLYNPKTADDLLEAMRESPEAVMKSGIKVQTVHAAKGEEYRRVIVAGADQFYGKLPEDVEDMTRLFFVAVTRAKDDLLVTCSLERTRFTAPNRPPVMQSVEPGRLHQTVSRMATEPAHA